MLLNNASIIVKTIGSGNLLKTIHDIYGLEVSSNMIEIKGSNDDYDINGYISKPIIQRKTRNFMNTIVNGRVVRNIELNKIINDAYYTYKPDNFYPIVVINIETDPTLIDVNIHPTKQDIKFSKMDVLRNVITDTIKNALYQTMLVPEVESNKNENDEESSDYSTFIENALPKALFIKEDEEYYENRKEPINSDIYDKNSTQESLNFSSQVVKNEEIKHLELYPVGIAFGTYIFAENKEGIYLIDQHAAVERINYEDVLKGLIKKDTVKTLIPITIELSSSEAEIIKERLNILTDLGFELEEFGINTFKINGHPSWIKEGLEYETIRTIFDLLIEEKKFDALKFNDKIAATIACKKSLKGNTRITLDMASKILENLVLCDNPYNCPHGRPTIIKFTLYELEKMFKRSM